MLAIGSLSVELSPHGVYPETFAQGTQPGREPMLHQQGRALAHAPADARRADPAALAGEGGPQGIAAASALRHQEALLEVPARRERLGKVLATGRQTPRQVAPRRVRARMLGHPPLPVATAQRLAVHAVVVTTATAA